MLEIHFLNVGHGDCTIIRHPTGRITMVDINNGDDIDNNTFNEIRSALLPSNTLGSIFAGLGSPPSYRSTDIGGLFDVQHPPLFGLGSVGRAAAPPSMGGLLAALATLPDRKLQLKQAGYDVSLTNPIEYFLKNFPRQSIHRYIQTHPDLDHMRGLSEVIRHGIGIANFWDTAHTKRPDLVGWSDHEDWAEYQRLRQRTSDPTCLKLYRNAVGSRWNHDPTGGCDHDGIEILSPSEVLTRQANYQQDFNKLSYVLRIHYAKRQIILGGDADESAWEDIVNTYGSSLKCDVLKASHHGRDSGYESSAVRLMRPAYTIVSVGRKPDTDASNKYRQYCNNVWSTRWYGNLTLRIYPNGHIEWVGQYVR